MINDRLIDQAYSDLRSTCGGVREDYFGLLYLEREHKVLRDKAVNQVAFGGNDYGFDAFHFDEERRNLYLFQFKYSDSHSQFKGSLQRLIEDGVDRIFLSPNQDDAKNQLLLQLRSCLIDNRAVIDQICFRFVFTGDPEEAERSKVLDKLRENLENKRYLVEQFFAGRNVGFVVEFRSASGRVGVLRDPRKPTSFEVPLTDLVVVDGPAGQKMHLGFIRLADLHRMHLALDSRFFDSNIRYGLGEGEAVNRAISGALKKIIIEKTEQPAVFAFDHNGITLFAERVELLDGRCRLTAPRLLNGAQTVTTVAAFREKNKGNPKLDQGQDAFESIRVL
ncbi:MAG: AIPR family protein [Acidobacteria bacterium]|nr:AIPR family protein [Acidobacteriota bacterium]